MLILPRGSTGFGQGKAPPLVDQRPFRTALYSAARVVGRTVEPLELPGVAFFEAFTAPHAVEPTMWVVVSKTVAILGWSHHDPRVGASPAVVDPPVEPEPFDRAGWHVLTAAEASEPLTSEALVHLDAAERREAAHWKPSTVAELLFNRWD